MSGRDKALLVVLVWACVYPGVLALTYLLQWLSLGLPLWAQLALSTACTVPAITVIAIPWVEKAVAAASHRTPAELKLDQARQAPGPDPEDT
jgi:antibiotic biosynthesis monooxygenase (ABM) superfamily enzyme